MSQRNEVGHSRPEVITKNPSIDAGTVKAYEKLERKLNRLGVRVKPEYGIEPPLGSYRSASRTLGRE